MTNKEAIGIVEDIGFYVSLLDSQKEALEKVVHDAKKWNKMIDDIPYWTIDYESHSCEEINEGLRKIAEIVSRGCIGAVLDEDIRDDERRV